MQALAPPASRPEPCAKARREPKTERPAQGGAWRQAVAIATALLVSVSMLASAGHAPLPALGWAAAFVFLAVESDVREHRIPNWLTFPAFGLAVLHAAFTGGLPGAGWALLAAALALALLAIPYSRGWFGAGDVKALMVLGALWGIGVLVPVLTWAIVWGGLLALAWMAARGALSELLARWWASLALSLSTRRWSPIPPPPGSPAAGGIPFAVTIGLGIATYQLWGTPWS